VLLACVLYIFLSFLFEKIIVNLHI